MLNIYCFFFSFSGLIPSILRAHLPRNTMPSEVKDAVPLGLWLCAQAPAHSCQSNWRSLKRQAQICNILSQQVNKDVVWGFHGECQWPPDKAIYRLIFSSLPAPVNAITDWLMRWASYTIHQAVRFCQISPDRPSLDHSSDLSITWHSCTWLKWMSNMNLFKDTSFYWILGHLLILMNIDTEN